MRDEGIKNKLSLGLGVWLSGYYLLGGRMLIADRFGSSRFRLRLSLSGWGSDGVVTGSDVVV